MNKLLLLCLATATIIFACKKAEVVEETAKQTVENSLNLSESSDSKFTSEKGTLEDSYLGDRVKTLMLGILELSYNNDFVKIVNEEVALQFDDDDNVLFKKLSSVCFDRDINLEKEMNKSITKYQFADLSIGHIYDGYSELRGDDVIKGIIDGFKWNDQHYFLQLYIPFVNDVNLTDIPVICFGHEEVESTIGFKLNKDGKVEVLEVDEAYAKKHLVWVVSVNEVVNELGELDTEIRKVDQGGARTLGRKVEVSQIFVNDRKENWLKGKGEIYMVAAILNTSCNYRKILPLGCMVKISKAEEGQWKNVNPSNSNVIIFANGWSSDPLLDSERICFELYEKDVHGARSYTPCSGAPALNYKSKNTPYGSRIYSASSFPNSTTLQTTQVTPWSHAGMRVLNRAWN